MITDYLTTTLRHRDGGMISSKARIPPTKDIQKFGGAISYMKRYALQALLFVPTEDLDGEDAMVRKKPKVVKKVVSAGVPF